MRPKSSFASSGNTSSSPSCTSFLMRRALSIMMCFSGSKRTFRSSPSCGSSSSCSDPSSSSSSGFSIDSSTTILIWLKLVVPVARSNDARTIWPRFPYSFLYAVASACSIASIIFSREMPRSSSISLNTEWITFRSNIFFFCEVYLLMYIWGGKQLNL